MKCALNISFANRQVILHRVREVFTEVFGRLAEDLGMHMIYDVAHNTAKLESHQVNGKQRILLVHRKGATRAFGPGRPELPEIYRQVGQPVIIGGSMETGSYLLMGTPDGAQSFFSTAHGSGRTMSRRKARQQWQGEELLSKLEKQGIYIRSISKKGAAEEAGGAYKDINDVVAATELAGLSKPVVRVIPIGNIKG
jgi:tRNA-splicing ligase RtcB